MRPLFEIQYFPPVSFFAHVHASPIALLEAHENYVKGSYRNRCHIASANGVQRLSIPLLKGKHQRQDIRSVRISYDQPWQSNHWHAIRSAYGNSPFFEHFEEEVSVFFKNKKPDFLWDFNMEILHAMMDLAGVQTKLELTEEYHKEPPQGILDLRNQISPKAKKPCPNFQPAPYAQVFSDRFDFQADLSILDLLFCAGPATSGILRSSFVST